ncbi:MraY family glycosyltransferase [Streptomyces sp. JB150]|uniref:MraY family glycosyltransferase n=1 Tax=Streptomyces sp. JB150 TaxID=2714844 RepID=UPI0014093A90|nr:MraY family glycosyltransferase [Streptomyces sp. JB150]QIJ63792.1 undecaprenyl/decaprenyl-phosphate alpha-N-acetylglucosaminyl 1-phosphate transferase [Streptomyces sp. JB150]
MLYGIAAATAALVAAALLAALLRAPAQRLGLLDRRRRDRPLPLLGGVAVVLPTAGVATLGDLTAVAPLGEGVAALLAAAAGIALLGLVADVRPLRTRALFAGTAVAAAWVMPYEETGVLGGVLAAGWVASIALAFRALDHADGLAGTVGVVTAFGAGVCAAAEVMDGLAVLLSVLAAALTGFLMHNWPPARIGLGACGSLFTGFLLAAAAVLTRAGREPGESAAVLFALTAVAAAQPVLAAGARWRDRRRAAAIGPSRRRGPVGVSGRTFADTPGRAPADTPGRVFADTPGRARGDTPGRAPADTPDGFACRLRRRGMTAQGAVVVTAGCALGGVAVGVLVHTGSVGAGAVWWVLAGVVGMVVFLCRSRRRKASAQVGSYLRVRNG